MAVADHLLISVHQTHAHLRHAGVLARHQEPLRMPLPSKTFVPGPWRKFRLMRIPVQLTLDLGEQQEFYAEPKQSHEPITLCVHAYASLSKCLFVAKQVPSVETQKPA